MERPSLRLLPATDPADQQRIINPELDDGVQLLTPLVQQVIQLEETNIEEVKYNNTLSAPWFLDLSREQISNMKTQTWTR